MEKVNIDNGFIAEVLDIHLEKEEELSLQMLNELQDGKGDDKDE